METPNLNKIYKHKADICTCIDFLEWFCEKHTVFKTSDKPEPVYTGAGDHINIEKIVHEYFGINDDEAENERQLVLDKMTKGCAAHD